jgi:hypothetical protein
MVYDLPLVDEKVKPHQVTSLHLISSLAFIVAGVIIFVYNYTITYWGLALLLTGVLLLAVTVIKNKWATSDKINPALRIAELFIAAWIAIYSATQHWKFPMGIFGVLSAAILFSIYWERPANRALFVHIDREGVKLPVTYRKRFLPWTEIEKIVLRYGTLTIDCADNSLFQWSLADNKVDQGPFESWCSNQVEEHRSKRRSDDW